jgi:hypothetical protein
MYSSAPDGDASEALDTDHLILDWLVASGHCSAAQVNIEHAREPPQAVAGLEDASANVGALDWQQDYRACLLRVTVCVTPS